MRLKIDSSPVLPRSFPLGQLGRLRPEPCLEAELEERFLGRKVRARFFQRHLDRGFGDEEVILLGQGTDRPRLDERFLVDVRDVVYNWLAFWSAFRRPEVKAAFLIEISASSATTPETSFDIRPASGNLDVPFILSAIRRNGAVLRPTLH